MQINTFLSKLLAQNINIYFFPKCNVLNTFQSLTRWRHQKSSFQQRKSPKLACCSRQSYTFGTMFSTCHFRIKKKKTTERHFTDGYRAERGAKISAWWYYQWKADVCRWARIWGLNSQSDMIFCSGEKTDVTKHTYRITEHQRTN